MAIRKNSTFEIDNDTLKSYIILKRLDFSSRNFLSIQVVLSYVKSLYCSMKTTKSWKYFTMNCVLCNTT